MNGSWITWPWMHGLFNTVVNFCSPKGSYQSRVSSIKNLTESLCEGKDHLVNYVGYNGDKITSYTFKNVCF